MLEFLIIVILFCIPTLFLKAVLGRSIWKDPAGLFSLVFGLVLIMANFSSRAFGFYEISLETYAIFGCGNLSFIAGNLLINGSIRKNFIGWNARQFDESDKMLFMFAVIILTPLLLYIPIAYREFTLATPNMPFALKILRTREKGLDEQVFSTLTNNLIVTSSLLVLLATYLYSRKSMSILFFLVIYAVFIFYNFITGTRSSILLLSLSCYFVYILRARYISKFFVLTLAVAAIAIGGVIAIFMGKDGMDRNQGIVKNLDKVGSNYFSYAVQGVILFDNYVVNRGPRIADNWDILSGAKEVTNKAVGSKLFHVDSKFSDFSQFSSKHYGNVYTIYFSIYPKYGLVGVILFFLLYGSFAGIVYKYSMGVFLIFLGYINAAICLSIFNEQLFTNLIFTIKLVFFLLVAKSIACIFGNLKSIKMNIKSL